jgi:hypothetical protein
MPKMRKWALKDFANCIEWRDRRERERERDKREHTKEE